MKNVAHQNIWRTGAVPNHGDPSMIHLITIKLGLKMERGYVKIKLRKNPMSENWTRINSKFLRLTMASWNNSFCFCEISI